MRKPALVRQKTTISHQKNADKRTKTEKAYDSIKDGILLGEIEEGAFLSEPEITARYGIGRTPFREACNRLHHEGLLQVVPRHGYFVPEISFHAVRDIFEVRVILEDAVAELAAARATQSDIDEIQRLAAKTWPPNTSPSQFAEFIQANTDFHMALARSTRNRVLCDLLARNLESTKRVMYMELRAAKFRVKDLQKLHLPIAEALRKRDPGKIREALLRDILDAQRTTFSFVRLDGAAKENQGGVTLPLPAFDSAAPGAAARKPTEN